MSQIKPDPQLKEISEKLSTLIQISTAGLLKDAKNQREKITLLSYAGLQPAKIAEILGTTNKTVSKELSIMKGSKKGIKGKKLKDAQENIVDEAKPKQEDGKGGQQ